MPRHHHQLRFLVEIEVEHLDGVTLRNEELHRLVGEVLAESVGVDEPFSIEVDSKHQATYDVCAAHFAPLDAAQVKRLTSGSY